MFRHRVLLLSAWLALGSLLIASCSTLPTQPVTESQSPPSLKVFDEVEQTALLSPVSTTKVVRGLLGGVVAAGDFKVVVPPLAVTGTVTITVTQPDPSKLECDLQISPASANQFRLPVLLVANGSKLDLNLLKVSYISWYNPSTAKWELVPGSSVDLLNLTVQAPLWHFSQYRVEGKGGW